MAELVPQMVRDYLQATGTTGQWSNELLGSNIAAARGNLQRWTGRQFEPQGSNTAHVKKFTTHGKAVVTLPGLVSATSVSLQETTLDADETYWLIPDKQQSGTHTQIQLRAFGRDYRGNPDWFDRNLDHWRYSHWSLPNDLVIAGHWDGGSWTPEYLQAWTVLAAWETIRTDASFSNQKLTPAGNVIDLSDKPDEVQTFVRNFSLYDSQVEPVG